ncbi:ABC transporter substrate-binding protein [uncultured Alsobacter sp.]|uniref:ABC transporter substrate-binding protein n=1 Tax=uncultured Alsobacter sp. TaxID=1748258 RepID=UPI0025F10E83|nr:extracellular solute-binding protein [uncultured Alsobacter sp.]
MTIRTLAAAAALSLVFGASAQAACAFKNDVPVKSLTAGFQAWKSVTSAMAECGNVQAELDQDFGKKQPEAFAAKPSLYQIGGVAAETFVPLNTAGTIRPLDDLVAKYGQKLTPNQLVKVDGKVMAIAMMVNAQHLMYRKDVFDQLGIAEPKTYDDVLAAAAKIKAAGVMATPIGATMRTGFNLGQDFVNLYMGYGGQFFGEGNMPALSTGDAGVKTLEMMKKLTAYMDPEYLTADSTVVQKQFQQGKIAMANFWASRAGALDDAKESTVVGKIAMAAAPAAVPGGKPATTVWWDGAVIAKNISDAEADAAFRVLMEGMDKEMVTANNADAVWLIDGYVPGRSAEGALASMKGGAPAYPAAPRLGLLTTAIGNTLADFFTGKSDAMATLKAIEAKYVTSAKEAGLIK